jgi:hypothetical protein
VRQKENKDTMMFVARRSLEPNGTPIGSIIECSLIARAIQLVPRFGAVAAKELNATNSMDLCESYFLNSFADKEIYQAVY